MTNRDDERLVVMTVDEPALQSSEKTLSAGVQMDIRKDMAAKLINKMFHSET